MLQVVVYINVRVGGVQINTLQLVFQPATIMNNNAAASLRIIIALSI